MKSASHHVSQNEIDGDNPCYQHLSEGQCPVRSVGRSQSSLLLHNQRRVVVENQPPVPLLYPYPGKPVVTGDSFAPILPIHRGAASLDSRVSVYAHLNLFGGDGLEFQFTGRKI